MEKIQPGKYIEFTYDLSKINADGSEEVLHQMVDEDPEKAIFGVTQGFVPALERGLENLQPGDTFDIVATPEEGFGPYSEEEISTLPREIFLIDGKFDEDLFKPGLYVPMMTADGYQINGVIKEVTPEHVVVDFNHPLAKDTVRFKGKVTEVRDPRPEELQPAEGCHCGHCGCHDGDEGACGCGDDCGCTEDDHCGCGGHPEHDNGSGKCGHGHCGC